MVSFEKRGGHNVGGSCIENDVVMIDLSKMNSVFVDNQKKECVVQGGLKTNNFKLLLNFFTFNKKRVSAGRC